MCRFAQDNKLNAVECVSVRVEKRVFFCTNQTCPLRINHSVECIYSIFKAHTESAQSPVFAPMIYNDTNANEEK